MYLLSSPILFPFVSCQWRPKPLGSGGRAQMLGYVLLLTENAVLPISNANFYPKGTFMTNFQSHKGRFRNIGFHHKSTLPKYYPSPTLLIRRNTKMILPKTWRTCFHEILPGSAIGSCYNYHHVVVVIIHFHHYDDVSYNITIAYIS